MNDFLNVKTLCKILGIDKVTMYRWCREGRIPFVRVSPRVLRFDADEIEVWLAGKRKQ